jgi:hypothetical protein
VGWKRERRRGSLFCINRDVLVVKSSLSRAMDCYIVAIETHDGFPYHK